MAWTETKIRMVVTGTANSGKTVFLISLLSLLEYSKDEQIRDFKPVPLSHGCTPLPYEEFYSKLARDGTWPRKTCDRFWYQCRFQYRDTRYLLELLDFPGERMADTAMVLHPDYAAWSDAILDSLKHADIQPYFEAFHDAQRADNADSHTLLAAYKFGLAGLTGAGMGGVTPSVFLLDSQGQSLPNADRATLAKKGRCGLAEDSEFFPLPKALRDRNPQWVAHFAQYYQEYRARVVLPLFQDIRAAHALAILVDIPGILMKGTAAYNTHQKLLESFLRAVPHQSGWIATGIVLDPVVSLDVLAPPATGANCRRHRPATRLAATGGLAVRRYRAVRPRFTHFPRRDHLLRAADQSASVIEVTGTSQHRRPS